MSSFDLIFRDFDNLFDYGSDFVRKMKPKYPVDISFAGYAKEDLDIVVENGYLKVVADNKDMGKCNYTLFIGKNVDEEDIVATMKNGLLKIDVKEKKKEMKKIEIK